MRRLFFFIIFIVNAALLAESFAQIERRREQYLSNPGYLVVPAPYSLAGIGSGVMVLGMANNIYETQSDVMLFGIGGDIGGYGFGVRDLYLVDKHFKVELLHSSFDKASFQSYSTRGMESANDTYINIEIARMKFTALRSTLSFYEKMLEFYAMAYLNSYRLESLKDKDGNTILDASQSKTQSGEIYIGGFMLDYTDDRQDPRRGVRLDASIDYAPKDDGSSPDYYVSSYNLTGYLPLGRSSTWVFNVFGSDAHVMRKGETDYDTLAADMGLDCAAITDPDEQQQCESYINNAIAANTYGTSTSLGGRSRLRSYIQGRFSGAHTSFVGTELRWNITDEATPFDLWFMKDIRTGIQSALFYETGSVSESMSKLWKSSRQSYGIGLRMITASGLVYRLDMANGDEGSEMTLIINYPWELF